MHTNRSLGYPPYHPCDDEVLLYAYTVGVYSSRRSSVASEDIAFRYGSGNPDFRTINTYRKRHLKEFRDLFVRAQLCGKLLVKLVPLRLVRSQSKRLFTSHELRPYAERRNTLQAEIDELLRQVEQVSNREDKRFGDRRGDEHEELAIREKRLQDS